MYRILLIDDEPMVKLGFRKLLENSDYIIANTASNGMEALSYLQTDPVDIILTDLKMPVMNGIELLQHLKALSFEGVSLVLSNYSDFELVRQALLEGASDYLLKTDITRSKLLEHLEKASQILEQKTSQRRETARRDKQLLDSQRLLYTNEWQEYLLHGTPLTTGAQKLLFSGKSSSISLILLHYETENLSLQKQKRILNQTMSILPDLLKGSGENLYLKMGEFDLLCLTSVPHSSKDILSIADQIIRRFKLYFNVSPIISYESGISAPDVVAEHFLRAKRALDYHFYNPEKNILTWNPAYAAQPVPDTFFQDMEADLAACLKRQDSDALRPVLSGYLGICAKNLYEPFCLKTGCVSYMERISMQYNRTDYPPEMIKERLTGTASIQELFDEMLNILHRAAACPLSESAPCKKEIQNVLAYIYSHYAGHFELEDIAAEAGLNKSYLCRLFKQEMGMSIFQYINQVRMEKSAQLIRNEGADVSIRKVALSVGFDDPFYFTRRFKAFYKKSPTEYAKEHSVS